MNPIPGKRKLMSNLWMLLLTVIVIYIALVVFVYFTQSNMLYFPQLPSRDLGSTPDRHGLAYEEVKLVTTDGVSLHGWFLPVANPRATLLFFHGNAGNISHRIDSLQVFHDLGLEILIIDYRGYGQSEGEPSEKGTYLDAESAWRYLTEEKKIPPRRILIFGRSLGAAVASHLARNHEAQGLILESAFLSVPDIAATRYPFLPMRLLSRFHYDNRRNLHAITMPVLIAHSRDDELIPYEHGRELFAAAREPKQFLQLRGGHNNGYSVAGKDYIRGLDRFIQSCTSARREPGEDSEHPTTAGGDI